MSNPMVTVAVSRLRYPWLLALTGFVLVLDLMILDFIPFVDEIILAAMTTLFATWRERRNATVPQGSVVATVPAQPAKDAAPKLPPPVN